MCDATYKDACVLYANKMHSVYKTILFYILQGRYIPQTAMFLLSVTSNDFSEGCVSFSHHTQLITP